MWWSKKPEKSRREALLEAREKLELQIERLQMSAESAPSGEYANGLTQHFLGMIEEIDAELSDLEASSIQA